MLNTRKQTVSLMVIEWKYLALRMPESGIARSLQEAILSLIEKLNYLLVYLILLGQEMDIIFIKMGY